MPTVAEIRDAAADRAAGQIERIIGQAMAAAADALEQTGSPTIGPDLQRDLEAAFLSLWGAVIRDTARETIGDYKSDFGLETKADEESFFDGLLRSFAEFFGGLKIVRVANTTREQAANITRDGQLRGLTLAEIAKEIREAAPIIAKQRSFVIARTEAHNASGYAAHETAKTSRTPRVKEWVAVEDHRTRDFGEGDGVVDEFSHRHMHGKQAAMDEPFKVPSKYGGTDLLMYPGDPNGAAGNVINCRCVVKYVRPEGA